MPPVLLLLLLIASGGTNAWQYAPPDKPEGWPGLCTDGKRQSPMDLVYETAERFSAEPLEFFNFKPFNGTITNNGHTVAIRFYVGDCNSGVTAGMLRALYILEELHFHWASEHKINGRRYDLELHMVHYNKKYGSLKEAKNQHDGIAVIGILFKEAENGTDALDNLLEGVKAVSARVQATSHLPAKVNPLDLLPGEKDRHRFFRYSGSLTTPPCSETVTWTILENPMPVSKDQMKIFKLISTDQGILENNFRRTQDTNDRIVYLLSDNAVVAANSSRLVLLVSLLIVWYNK